MLKSPPKNPQKMVIVRKLEPRKPKQPNKKTQKARQTHRQIDKQKHQYFLLFPHETNKNFILPEDFFLYIIWFFTNIL